MKQIRLEFPICWGDDPNVYMPSKVYLKVVENQTEAYLDREFTQTVPQTEKRISFDVEVPEEIDLETIDIAPRGISTPVGDILFDWVWCDIDTLNWKIPGLNRVLVIVDGKKHEVPIINERPDFDEWKRFNSIEGEGRWWFMHPWALAVYVTDTKTFGGLHWHSKLARALLNTEKTTE